MASNYNGEIHSYDQALKALDAKHRNKDLVNLEYETRLIRKDNGDLAVQLFSTEVVVYHKDGSITLDSGGYRTPTTKDRINRYSPVSIIQNKGVWYVATLEGYPYKLDNVPLFEDGMTVDASGQPKVNKRAMREVQAKVKEVKILTARIKRYAKEFVEALFKGKVPQPSSGDCWFCCMHDSKTGRPLGDAIKDQDHILNHMTQHYYVPSLLVNASKMYGISIIAQDRIARAMAKEDISKDVGMNDIARQQIESALVRYLKLCLKIAT